MPPTAAIAGSAARRRLAELAVDELALDLQADDEEEDGHQAVVDPLPEVEVEDVVAEVDGQAGVPELDVGLLPRRVRPHEGDDGGGDAGRPRRPPRCAGSRAAVAARPIRRRADDRTRSSVRHPTFLADRRQPAGVRRTSRWPAGARGTATRGGPRPRGRRSGPVPAAGGGPSSSTAAGASVRSSRWRRPTRR